MTRAKKINATHGALIPLIISFVLPLILMTLIQKLFNAVDIAVLGNMAERGQAPEELLTDLAVHICSEGPRKFFGI